MRFGVDSRAELPQESSSQVVNATASVTPFDPVYLKRSDIHSKNSNNHTGSMDLSI
jgi:hypothetical protein